ncbi:MAG: response regulator [Puniceicoccaceae bacterium]|nr:MAG: response regulator [Puniceicoccaceae bacterium]
MKANNVANPSIMLITKDLPIRLLLCENAPSDLAVLCDYLKTSKLDFVLETSANLEVAKQQHDPQIFDLLLLNVSLLGEKWGESLKALQVDGQERAIILLTDSEHEEQAMAAIKQGAQDYLLKTELDVQSLEHSIKCALARNQRRQTAEPMRNEVEFLEALLQRIFRSNKDAMLVLSREHEIKFLNAAAVKLLEADQADLIGEIFPFEVREGEVTELEIPTSDDWIHTVELNAFDLVWKGEDSLLVILREITSSPQVELELSQENIHLDGVLGSISQAVILIDARGKIERLNEHAAELIHANRTGSIGRPLDDVLKLKDAQTGKTIKKISERLLLPEFSKSAKALKLTLERSDGASLPVTVVVECILNAVGIRQGAIIVLDELCEPDDGREAARFEVEKLSAISLLAGGIAHDFNNMLTAIMGNISLARMELADDNKLDEKLIAAEKAALQAKSLSQQLLSFTKSGTPILQYTSIFSIVEECAQFILRGSNVKCVVKQDEDLWAIDADQGQFCQVINNLILNANQAMPTGGTIHIRLRNLSTRRAEVKDLPPGDYVGIEIWDAGTGISAETLKHIFDPYFTTKEDGNGLGLASALSITQSHKGTITADSSPGCGSVFRVYLPKSLKTLSPPKSEEPKTGALPPSTETIHNGRGRVLVMDDMEAMMLMASEIIGMLGYDVACSANGEEAIAAYKAAKEAGNPFDAVVFDLTVPGGMGGEEAANRLLEYDPELRAIASSGYSNSNVMSDYKDSAFKAVVPKPYRIKEMSDALHFVIQGTPPSEALSKQSQSKK